MSFWNSLGFSMIKGITRASQAALLVKKVKVKVIQSCLTLCDPMDYTVHGFLQARILEWVAFPFSRTSSQPRDRTQVSWIAGRFFTSSAAWEALVIPLIMEKPREFQKDICFCFIDYAKAFDCVDHNKLWKILREMGIPDDLTCLLRNLYAGQEATVTTGHGSK